MVADSEHDNPPTYDETTPLLARGSPPAVTGPEIANAPPSRNGEDAPASDYGTSSSSTAVLSTTSSAAQEDDEEEAQDVSNDKPFPITQILVLCYARLVEPIAFFSIFPYISQMVASNGNLPPSDTGFYAGLIESIFSLTQMMVMISWGRLSDSRGRKPVLVISLIGVALATVLFGFAKTIWQMILFRCIAGVFAGTVVTIRTMCAEHSTQDTQARIFSWFATASNLGIMIGPLIGGALADPVKQYPKIFGDSKILKDYPYALASLVPGLVAFSAVILVSSFVVETLPASLRKKGKLIGAEAQAEAASILPGRSNTDDEPLTGFRLIWALVKYDGVSPVLYLYAHVMVLAYTYTAIIPVFWYEPIEIGGFGFQPLHISLFMGLVGFSQAIWLLLIFPPLQHRIGTGGVMRLCAYFYPFFFAGNPGLSVLLRQKTHAGDVAFWVLAPILIALGSGVSMAFTAIQLALNDVAPSPQTLGTVNGLAMTLVSGVRAFSPAAATSLYAVGVRYQILDGYLAWLVLVALACGFTFAMRWFPKIAEGKIARKTKKKK